LPVISVAAEEFLAENPGLNVIVNGGGSGVGINQLGEGKVEMGMISRGITDEEKNLFPNVNFNPISIGKDAVVPVVSSEIYNSGVKSLTLKQIGNIYQGKIVNWKEVGGPDKDILCVDKEASRGTRHIFMEVVLSDKQALAEGADLVLGSNNEEQTSLAQSDAAIGMLSHAWLNDDVKGLAITTEEGETIQPTIENILNNTFPIVRDLVIVTNGEPKGNLKDFVDFLLSEEGQKIVESQGYVGITK
jgi:phosphate transport system substrate-binding protein